MPWIRKIQMFLMFFACAFLLGPHFSIGAEPVAASEARVPTEIFAPGAAQPDEITTEAPSAPEDAPSAEAASKPMAEPSSESAPKSEIEPQTQPQPPEISEEKAAKPAGADPLDELQDRYVRLMTDRLLLLFRTTKLKNPLLNVALTHLIVEFLVLDRLRHPEREAPLSFEKSVAIRMAMFRRLPDESAVETANPPPDPENARSDSATVRRYGVRFPLNMRTERDRLAALILLWMEENDKDIRTLTEEYRRVARERWPGSEDDWNAARTAAGRLSEKSLADLSKRKERAVFSLRWGKLDRPVRKAVGTGTPLDPLSLLFSQRSSESKRSPSHIGD